MKDLPNDIDSLKILILELLEENKQLKAEIAKLRGRLGLNSGNSHKPPSSDGYKKTTKPAIPKSVKHPHGGKVGHKGKTLKQVSNPDHVKVHLPEKCTCCGRKFSEKNKHQTIKNRQVFDIPDPKLEVTKHQIGQITCCGVKQHGKYPKLKISKEPQCTTVGHLFT